MSDERDDQAATPEAPAVDPTPAPKGGRTAPGVCSMCQAPIMPSLFLPGEKGIMHKASAAARRVNGGSPMCGPIWTEFTYHFVYVYAVPALKKEGMDRCFQTLDNPLITRGQVELMEAVLAAMLSDHYQATDETGHTLVGVKPEVRVRIMDWKALERR